MSEQLNLGAERAAFEAWVASKGDADIAWLERDKRHGFYINLTVSAWWEAWQAARRAAPVGEVELPPLPKESAWMVPVDGVYEYYATRKAAEVERSAYEHEMGADAEHQEPEPLYTAEQVRQAQRQAFEAGRLAAIADSQREVARDLAAIKERLAAAKQPAQSIGDDPEFRQLLRKVWLRASMSGSRLSAEEKDLIAYIDGRTAGAAWISVAESLPEDGQAVAFVVDSKGWERFDYLNGRVLGGTYNEAFGGFSVPGLTIGASYWMPLPAAPSPQPGKEGGNDR